MAEKEFKIQNGLRVLEETYLESTLDVNGIVTAGSFIGDGSGLTGLVTTDSVVSSGTTSTSASGIGYRGLPQVAAPPTGAPYDVVVGDAGKHIYITTTQGVVLPANLLIAFPIGTAITIVTGSGSTATISITSDTLILAGTGTTGSRTLAPFGMATAVKITSTSWIISGNGLS